MTQPSVWTAAREATNIFVGPLTLTVVANGTPVSNAAVKFAVVPIGKRPADTDWAPPDGEPDGDGIGVLLEPVDQPGRYGWWVQITVGDTVDVLEPVDVAWIDRT